MHKLCVVCSDIKPLLSTCLTAVYSVALQSNFTLYGLQNYWYFVPLSIWWKVEIKLANNVCEIIKLIFWQPQIKGSPLCSLNCECITQSMNLIISTVYIKHMSHNWMKKKKLSQGTRDRSTSKLRYILCINNHFEVLGSQDAIETSSKINSFLS